MAQNLHRTARGKLIDMNKLMNDNELEVAVSNVKINARGDELSPSGDIIRKETHEHSVGASRTPVHSHVYKPAPTAVPAKSQAVAAAPIVKEPTPAFETPNALIQPHSESKDLEKSSKGKQ
jgi:hypothetical protein